jgi:uracil-DNA glycosylase
MFIEKSWGKALESELKEPYFKELMSAVREAYRTHTVYPPVEDLFSAFALTPFSEVKVVILGQDPYHGEGQAHGLAFSVRDGVAVPPSLRNIYKEISSNIGTPPPASGNLTRLAKQGVLLLNNTLTVRTNEAGSHRTYGWEKFTDAVIANIGNKKTDIVFMLWGAQAQSKIPLIDNTKHLILTAPHPSPLSAYRGFFGCKHFSKANEYLIQHNALPIKW